MNIPCRSTDLEKLINVEGLRRKIHESYYGIPEKENRKEIMNGSGGIYMGVGVNIEGGSTGRDNWNGGHVSQQFIRVTLTMDDIEPNLVIVYNQTRLPVDGMGLQHTHKLFDL